MTPSRSAALDRGPVGPSGLCAEVCRPSDRHGRFVIDVPAGSYLVTGNSPMVQDGQGICRTATPLAVADGQTIAGVAVTCSIR